MQTAEHFVQFYESDEYIVGSVAEYIREGLSKGETCLTVASATHLEKIGQQLSTAGVDVQAVTADGRYITLDARQTLDLFMKDGMPDDLRFEAVIGSLIADYASKGTVRVFGEMVGILMAEKQVDACSKLEHLWEGICERHPITLYCAYPLDQFAHGKGSQGLITMCAHHSKVIPSESYVSTDIPSDRTNAIAFLQQRGKQLEAELSELRAKISARNPR